MTCQTGSLSQFVPVLLQTNIQTNAYKCQFSEQKSKVHEHHHVFFHLNLHVLHISGPFFSVFPLDQRQPPGCRHQVHGLGLFQAPQAEVGAIHLVGHQQMEDVAWFWFYRIWRFYDGFMMVLWWFYVCQTLFSYGLQLSCWICVKSCSEISSSLGQLVSCEIGAAWSRQDPPNLQTCQGRSMRSCLDGQDMPRSNGLGEATNRVFHQKNEIRNNRTPKHDTQVWLFLVDFYKTLMILMLLIVRGLFRIALWQRDQPPWSFASNRLPHLPPQSHDQVAMRIAAKISNNKRLKILGWVNLKLWYQYHHGWYDLKVALRSLSLPVHFSPGLQASHG